MGRERERESVCVSVCVCVRVCVSILYRKLLSCSESENDSRDEQDGPIRLQRCQGRHIHSTTVPFLVLFTLKIVTTSRIKAKLSLITGCIQQAYTQATIIFAVKIISLSVFRLIRIRNFRGIQLSSPSSQKPTLRPPYLSNIACNK
jgi:hypothetical protein